MYVYVYMFYILHKIFVFINSYESDDVCTYESDVADRTEVQ